MTRPPLTLALTSVLTAAVDGSERPALLATLRPDLPRPRAGRQESRADSGAGATVIPLPRVIPMPRRGPDPTDPDPFSAA